MSFFCWVPVLSHRQTEGEERGHSGGVQNRAATPLHQKEPMEVVQACI